MSGLGRCPDLRNPDLGGSTVLPVFCWKCNDSVVQYVALYDYKTDCILQSVIRYHLKCSPIFIFFLIEIIGIVEFEEIDCFD